MLRCVGATAERKRLNELISEANSVLECPPDTVQVVGDRRTVKKNHCLSSPAKSFANLDSFTHLTVTDCCILDVYDSIFITQSSTVPAKNIQNPPN